MRYLPILFYCPGLGLRTRLWGKYKCKKAKTSSLSKSLTCRSCSHGQLLSAKQGLLGAKQGLLSNRVKHLAESSAVSTGVISYWILFTIFYSHVRNDFGFHSKYFMVISEMILNSTQKYLLSCQTWFWILVPLFLWLYIYQKWFWIPLKLFYGYVRQDFGFHSKYFMVICSVPSNFIANFAKNA